MAEEAYIEGPDPESQGQGNDDSSSLLTTRAGFRIDVNSTKSYCTVSYEDRVESPRDRLGNRSSQQAIPYLYFIGNELEPVFPAGEIELASARGGRVQVPFRHYPDRQTRQFTVRVHSGSDQFPVYVGHYASVRDLLAEIESNRKPRAFALVDRDIPRIDLIMLKVKRPDLSVLILHSETEGREGEGDQSHARAGDMVDTLEPMDELRGDPVFLARIHLRNLDLEATRELVLSNSLSFDEIQFIRTFLSMMIRNERGDRDLMAAQRELQHLDEYYRLATKLLFDEAGNFDQELDQGIEPAVAQYLIPLVKKLRSSADSKDDEIYLWEVEYRLSRQGN